MRKKEMVKKIKVLEEEVRAIWASLYRSSIPRAVWNDIYDFWMFLPQKKGHKIKKMATPLLGEVEIILEDKEYKS